MDHSILIRSRGPEEPGELVYSDYLLTRLGERHINSCWSRLLRRDEMRRLGNTLIDWRDRHLSLRRTRNWHGCSTLVGEQALDYSKCRLTQWPGSPKVLCASDWHSPLLVAHLAQPVGWQIGRESLWIVLEVDHHVQSHPWLQVTTDEKPWTKLEHLLTYAPLQELRYHMRIHTNMVREHTWEQNATNKNEWNTSRFVRVPNDWPAIRSRPPRTTSVVAHLFVRLEPNRNGLGSRCVSSLAQGSCRPKAGVGKHLHSHRMGFIKVEKESRLT